MPVRQVRVRFDLQRPLGAGESPPERRLSSAAGRPDEHLCEPDEGRVDVRSSHLSSRQGRVPLLEICGWAQLCGEYGRSQSASNNFHVLSLFLWKLNCGEIDVIRQHND